MLELVRSDSIKPAVKNFLELPIKSCFQQALLLVLPHFLLPIKPWLQALPTSHPPNGLVSKDQHSTTLMKANICLVWKMDETPLQQIY